MKFNEKVFKSYDVRGLVGVELTENLAFAIGVGTTELLARKYQLSNPKVMVGFDMRETSLNYAKAVYAGILFGGGTPGSVGLISSPGCYSITATGNFDGCVMVTASHNGPAYNGFKVCGRLAEAIGLEGGLGEVMERARSIEENDYSKVTPILDSLLLIDNSTLVKEQVLTEIEASGINLLLPKAKVVVDSGNGMGVQYLKEYFSNQPAIQVIYINEEYDGHFPNHEADPYNPKNNLQIEQAIKDHGADYGVATDGDGDRIFFFDSTGARLAPAVARGLAGWEILRQSPKATIGVDIRPGKATEMMVNERGGTVLYTKVGHTHIKLAGLKHNLRLAAEASGHFCLRVKDGFYEAPIGAMQLVLSSIIKSDKTMAELNQKYNQYVHSGEVNLKTKKNISEIYLAIKQELPEFSFNEFDGLIADSAQVWFNVRPSNTEPVIRLAVEGVNKEFVKTVVEKITNLVVDKDEAST